jgi:hypothetical protein
MVDREGGLDQFGGSFFDMLEYMALNLVQYCPSPQDYLLKLETKSVHRSTLQQKAGVRGFIPGECLFDRQD